MKPSDFVHVHVHSQYSKFDGFASVQELAATAKSMGMRGVGLTDHGTMAGAIAFIKACRKEEIAPILGMESYHARNHKARKDDQPDGRKGNRHINLIAKNLQGFKNLATLSQTASLEGYYYDPRIDLELLSQHKEGLIVTSACPSSLINWNLQQGRYDKARDAAAIFKDIFGDDFYLEVMFHGLEVEAKIIPMIQKLSKELDVKIIATNDVHYITKEDSEYHEMIMCISSNRCIRDPKRIRFPYSEFYFKSTEEMAKVFSGTPSFLTNTIEILEKCDYSDLRFVEEGGSMKLPKFGLPSGFKTPHEFLRHLAYEGADRLGIGSSEPHIDRLNRELDDIDLVWKVNQFDFATYFLIVHDIIEFARRSEIAFGVRGSGYGSLLLMCLGITEGVDPLSQDLMWERFLGFTEKRFFMEDDFGPWSEVDGLPDSPVKYKDAIDAIISELTGQEEQWCSEAVERELRYLEENDSLSTLQKMWDLRRKNGKRGSENKVNSFICALLNITAKRSDTNRNVDLPLRRTYGRVGWPDIDIDFCYLRRQEVIDYLIDKYGRGHVGSIGTIQTMKTKAAVRRAIKLLDPSNSIRYDEEGKEIKTSSNENFRLENEILSSLPDLMKLEDGTVVENIQMACDAYPEFKEYMETYPEVHRVAERIEGTISAYGCHAAGVVVSPVPLQEICPLHITQASEGSMSEKGTTIATQFTMAEVESIGLVKIDILGLSTKTAIDWCTRMVKDMHGVDVDLANVPLDDPETISLLQTGHTDGCFQLENPGMKRALMDIHIDSFDDLVLTIAMYRPGPKQYIPEVAGRKRGERAITSLHPVLADVTKKTYGVVVYQEQIMKAFPPMLDVTPVDAYDFTRGCSKKKKHVVDKYRDLVLRVLPKKGVEKDTADRIWADLQRFAGYAFNKSLYFSEGISTDEGIYEIQELYRMRCSGIRLPRVYSPEGQPIKILDVYDHGVLPVFKVTFSDGSEHRCTANHRFATNCGTQSLRSIVENDLYVRRRKGEIDGEKKGLGMQGLRFYSSESQSKKCSLQGMRRLAETEVEDGPRMEMCRVRTGFPIRKTAPSSSSVLFRLEGCQIEELLEAEQNKRPEDMGKDKKHIGDRKELYRKNVQSRIRCNYEESNRTPAPVQSYDSDERYPQRIISEKQERNCQENFCTTGNSGTTSFTSASMERRKPTKIYRRVYPSSYETEKVALEARNALGRDFSSTWFQAFRNGERKTFFDYFTKKADRFHRSVGDDLGRIRWAVSFLQSLGQHWSSAEANQRSRTQCRDVSTWLSGNTDVIRHMASTRSEVQMVGNGRSETSFGREGTRLPSNDWSYVSVVNVEYVGMAQCYDLKVDSGDHLYCLQSGIVNSNSHSVSYAYESWKTAYLKAHYPTEFFAARMSVETIRRFFDDVAKFELDARQNWGFEFLPPDVNKSKITWSIVGPKKLRRPLLAKGIGYKAARDIVLNQPYKGEILFDFAAKTEEGVNSKVVEAMYDAGMWPGMDKSKVIQAFTRIRKERRNMKGRPTGEEFE